jgi:acyl phosphate:glycerol-3-phosphate acyltransferase
MQIEFVQALLIVVVSYLLGSIPTAYLIARLKKINIFEIGSGNMGGTNVARVMGIGWGFVVYALDALKGIAAIIIATHVLMPEHKTTATVIAAIVVIIGHNWSLFVALITGTLRGGKGAATAFGTILMIAPFQLIAVISVVGALLIAVTRYVSLAALVMMVISTAWMLILIQQNAVPWEYAIYTFFVAALIIVRFRENIQRLLHGTERRLGERT